MSKPLNPPHYSKFLKKAYILQLLEGSFSGPRLSRETGTSYGYTSNMLKEMLSQGLVTQTKESSPLGSGGRSNLRGLAPAVYMLTGRGRSLIRVVLSGGVFDILHPGHLAFIKEASNQGDVLVVVLARDSTVKKRKGRLPFNREQDRLHIISSLRKVDLAILGSRDYCQTIERVSPDMVFLGHDQRGDLYRIKSYLRKTGKRIGIVVSYKAIPGYSTSTILNSIKGT
jgi:cytidyltransferase-like protein